VADVAVGPVCSSIVTSQARFSGEIWRDWRHDGEEHKLNDGTGSPENHQNARYFMMIPNGTEICSNNGNCTSAAIAMPDNTGMFGKSDGGISQPTGIAVALSRVA
jgi:hypothetical protein